MLCCCLFFTYVLSKYSANLFSKPSIRDNMGFSGGSVVKNLPALQEAWVQSLCCEGLLEKEMAAHSSTLAWEISWTEESAGLQSMGLEKGQTWFSDTTTKKGKHRLKHREKDPCDILPLRSHSFIVNSAGVVLLLLASFQL